jgi:chemotaxis protein CheY-P-specific phosphatase CheC
VDRVFFEECAKLGVENSRNTLAVLTGRDLKVDWQITSCTDVVGLPMLSRYFDEIMLSSWVSFTGDMAGQLIVLFRPDSASQVISFLAPKVLGSLDFVQDPDLEESIVSEVANIVGCSFLDAIADRAGMILRPSPPLIIREMAGAILESAAAVSYFDSGMVPVANVRFSLGGGEAVFEIALLPRKGLNISSNCWDGDGNGP